MAKINESLRMEEEGNQQEMRRLITQRDNRVRAESFRQQLDDLQASEAAALQRVRSGRMAMQMAPQPQQLLLEYAQARVAEVWCRSLMWPTIPTARSCCLLPCGESWLQLSLQSEAKLAAATAALAATEAEIDEREAMLKSKRVRCE
jgi:hypothetical protein